MSVKTRHLLDYHDKKQAEVRANDEKFIKASELRLAFIDKFIRGRDTFSYMTQVERDHAYLADREYRYKVFGHSLAKSLVISVFASACVMLVRRKFDVFGLGLTAPLYWMYRNENRFVYNKRFFDMCNVGEQYELGRERNKILRICNEIQGVEDF